MDNKTMSALTGTFNDLALSALQDQAAVTCDPGHVIGTTEGNKPIEYLDGTIVGYCKHCKCRVTLPKMYGGLSVAFLKLVCTELLGGQFDADLMAQLAEGVEAVERDKEALVEVLEAAKLVREIVGYRLMGA
jgi:hypothetical protein